MKPECSLPHSQMPATCPYPVPARSSPYPHITLPEDSSYYPPIYASVSPLVSFPLVFPPKPCIGVMYNRCIKVWIDTDNTNVMIGTHNVKVIYWTMFNSTWWSQKTIFRLCLKPGFFNGAKPFRKRVLFPSSGRQNIYKSLLCLDLRRSHSDTSDSHGVHTKGKGKGKVIPLQARCGPQDG